MPASQNRSAKPKDNQPIFFYRPRQRYGIFSQWYESTFRVSNADITALVGTHINSDSPEPSTEFRSAEQFMMYCKAARFSDEHIQRRILKTTDPGGQKKLGQRVEGLSEDSWTEVKSQAVEMGNYAKFTQDPQFKSWLMGTGERELIEAALTDRIWGIGFFAETDAQVKIALENREHWGENRLGKALMAVRARIRNEMADKGVGANNAAQSTT
ncbi:hypothetical protein LIA77_03228 [Sarocladium implicatum]|nr:hypothetical protein LIA77_03228 [Sarocladium implicatum]